MITFNSVDLSQIGGINQIKRDIFPNIQLRTMKIPNRAGERLVKKEVGMRIIRVDMTLKDDNLEDRADELADALFSDEPVPITFSDQPDFTYYGMVSGVVDKNDIINNLGRVMFSIVCLDPYKYKDEQFVTTSTGVATIEINNYETFPIMQITFNAPATRIDIIKDEYELGIIWDFDVGHSLELDFERQLIKINGKERMTALDLTKPDYFLLERGENVITFSADCQAVIRYRERRL